MAYPVLFKTNHDFIRYMKKLDDEFNGMRGTKGKTKYMSSGTLSALTTENMNTFKSWSPNAWADNKVYNHIKPFLDKPGYYGTDCNNMLKAIFWGLDTDKIKDINKYTPNGPGVKRNSNGLDDISPDELFNICTNKSSNMKSILPGELVWMKGHIGVYYGKIDGVDYVIDVTISQGGLALNKMSNQKWTKHGYCPFIGTYTASDTNDDFNVDTFVAFFNNSINVKLNDVGLDVKFLQTGLNNAIHKLNLNFDELKVDGKFGLKTNEVVKYLKKLYNINEINVGILTLSKLASI